jgi:hypothetical protein
LRIRRSGRNVGEELGDVIVGNQTGESNRWANPDFEGFGYDDEGSTWVFDFILRGPRGSESDDLELRRQEAEEQ